MCAVVHASDLHRTPRAVEHRKGPTLLVEQPCRAQKRVAGMGSLSGWCVDANDPEVVIVNEHDFGETAFCPRAWRWIGGTALPSMTPTGPPVPGTPEVPRTRTTCNALKPPLQSCMRTIVIDDAGKSYKASLDRVGIALVDVG